MQIVMTTTQFGSPDGIYIHRFKEGEVYDADTWPMSRELARSFVQSKAAELVQNTTGPTENKDDTGVVAAKQKKESHSASSEVAETAPASGMETTHTKRRHA